LAFSITRSPAAKKHPNNCNLYLQWVVNQEGVDTKCKELGKKKSIWTIGIGVLFLVAAVGLFMYRRFGMQVLALALTANIVLQGLYAAQAVRKMFEPGSMVESIKLTVFASSKRPIS
jgi:hypothetical protein